MTEQATQSSIGHQAETAPEPVAVIGMALRVPGANTLGRFWANLLETADCLHRPSRAELERAGVAARVLSDPALVTAKPTLKYLEYFDAEFFSISESMAEQMDPGHRLFLECAWEAMEDGGIVPGETDQKTGVFAGVEVNEHSYLTQNLYSLGDSSPSISLTRRLGNSADYFTLRISHALNLIGPSFTSMATCSTSLLAVHQAVQNLRLGECTAAIVGGAKIDLPAMSYYKSGIDGMFSQSGVIRPFDANADGTIFGNGVAVVVLKLLKDALRDGNPVHAVILGTGFSNDGQPEDKQSFTAPTPSGQKRAIRHALNEALLDPVSIGFAECHGTGTMLGDPIEIGSLSNVYRDYSNEKAWCALGSVKGHVGHLGSAAGVVSLIKTCLVLENGVLPPVANFASPHPEIDIENSPFFIPETAMPWPAQQAPKRAAVSAFGFGGANAHVVLEQYRAQDRSSEDKHQLLVLSAKSKKALQRRISDLANHMEDHPKMALADMASTLQRGRLAMDFRSHICIDKRSRVSASGQMRGLQAATRSSKAARPLVFLFPGQGAQQPGMGQALYDNERVYRETIDYCANFLEKELGFDLREKIHRAEPVNEGNGWAALSATYIAQPALFSVEYALYKLYRHWGLAPDAMLGHSLGELVAACIAGVFSLDTGLRMVALRSRLMQKSEAGSMAAIFLPLSELKELIPDDLDLAAINAPTSNVVSGTTQSVERFLAELDEQGIGNRLLATSHAFHSRMLNPTIEEFRHGLGEFEFHAPTACTISNVSGLPLTEEQALNPDYWVNQRRRPVLFSEGLKQLLDGDILQGEDPIFVEVGPGRVLTGLVIQHDASLDTVTSIFDPREDASAIADRLALDALGKIWSLGGHVNWTAAASGSSSMVALPTYPFQRKYFWRDRSKEPEEVVHRYPLMLYEPGWTEKAADSQQQVDEPGHWLIFADDEGVGDQFVNRLRKRGCQVTVLEAGAKFKRISDSLCEIEPGSRDDIQQVLSCIQLEGEDRIRIVHFWNLTGEEETENELGALSWASTRGFHTLIALTQAAQGCGLSGRMDVQVYADGLAQLDPASDPLYPEKGSLLGPCQVIPQEIRGFTMRCIDIPGVNSHPADGSLLDAIMTESLQDTTDVLTALRADGRYVEGLFELPEISRGLPRLRFAGTVLITGGMGGLGLKIAEYLFETQKARLVLTSRWEAPPRAEWAERAGENTKIGRALDVLNRLVEQGAEVLIVKADARSRDELQRVIEIAEAEFSSIHGIVHAAGILDDGPSLQKSMEGTEKVFAAKVSSALILEELFKDKPLDLFVYFSSQASMRPSKGQVDYSAANAVLDRLAKRRQQHQPGLSCAIGWGAWREAGMAWEYQGSQLESASLFREKIGQEFKGAAVKINHPILETCRRYRDGDCLFSGAIVRGDHWIASEHVIEDRPVLSATMMHEMFRAAYMELCPNVSAVELSNMVFIEPFMVDDKCRFELILVGGGRLYKAELRSKSNSPGASWKIHARTTVGATENSSEIDPVIRQRLMSVSEMKPVSCVPMEHGPRWHCDWVGEQVEDTMAGHLRLKDQFHHEIDEFVLHPAVFDRAIHFIVNHFVGRLLPYTCQSLRIYGPLPAETLSYVQSSDMDADNAFDVIITNLAGELLIEIEGYVVRPAALDRDFRKDQSTTARPSKVVISKPGLLDSFEVQPLIETALRAKEVRISTRACGLNFRDVLLALGQLPENDQTDDFLGSECSGVVIEVGASVSNVKPGDRVLAYTSTEFATEVISGSHSVTQLPESLSFSEGASIPITFLTVHHALHNLALLEPGERILIHSATGGIGLAAVQMAQQMGAEIYATAGHEFKRDYLKNIGVDQVMDSRSLDFVDEIREATGGEGVDVVLNALAGEFIPASMSLLKPFGRFLEIGKKDIYADTQLGLYPFRNNLSYFGIDLGQLRKHRPEKLQRMFEDLMQRFATGSLRPSPITTFPVESLTKGFEFMARAQHIGKIVFSMEDQLAPADVAMDRFRSRFGKGIGVEDGLEVFGRLISSDETPPYVMVVPEPLAGDDKSMRYQVDAQITRVVDTPYREPGTANEEILKQIWEKTLGVSTIGVDDDFVELGGDSIKAIMIQTSVSETFDMDLSLAVLFRHSTISSLAKVMNKM